GTLINSSAGSTITGTLTNGPLWVAGPPAPQTPASLTAQPGNSQVTMNWTASANAASYSVKRCTISGRPHTTIASARATQPYTDTGLTHGTPYFYVVTASNLGGESGVSNQASATPLPPPPAAPSGLVASPSNAQVALTWNASATATSYSVKRATISGG